LVTLAARDLPALRRFYQALGWPEGDGASDDFTAFKTAGGVLALYGAAELADESGTPSDGPPRGFSLALNVDSREQVDEVMAAMVEAGATLRTPAEDKFWGGRSGYVADPEGNPWEVAWNPHWPFDARGALDLA
jgi:catechol 2,3-dioxygenase-like lactoylglutathione lyase family enzyme